MYPYMFFSIADDSNALPRAAEPSVPVPGHEEHVLQHDRHLLVRRRLRTVRRHHRADAQVYDRRVGRLATALRPWVTYVLNQRISNSRLIYLYLIVHL